MSIENLEEKAIKILDILTNESKRGLKAKDIATSLYGRKSRGKRSGRLVLPEIRKLHEFGLIENENIERRVSRWKITEKGREFLEKGA